MNILAIESSTGVFTAALFLEGKLVEREGAQGAPHSSIALPLLRALLADEGVGLADLDGIAFGAGPGSFTGLRLACGIAQGLARGAGLRLVAIGSLDAMALDAGVGQVYSCVDARMNEVYCAAYRVAAGVLDCVIEATVAPPHRAPVPPGDGWLGCGSGFGAYRESLNAALGAHISDVVIDAVPRAAAVARLAAPRFARGDSIEAALAAPLYVRDKVALTVAERIAQGGKA